MENPYKNIDWNTINKIVSVSHAHCPIDDAERKQMYFNRIINGGVEHFAISNYYPSDYIYPLSDKYTDIPSGAISCPNAEHHSFANYPYMHLNSLGSFFQSGLPRGEEPAGVNGADWRDIVESIIDDLQYADGGGITINHPIWSELTTNNVLKMLKYDNRVLGIEIFNASCERSQSNGWALNMWDDILITGQRCYGFCVPDHDAEAGYDPWLGRNILLVDNKNEHDCLVAYRNGKFYSRIKLSNLDFTNIEIDNNVLFVTTFGANKISIICDKNKFEYDGNSVSFEIPFNATYVRIEAESEEDMIFSNPIMVNKPKKTASDMMLWF